MSRIAAVTGASGRLGNVLVRALMERGYAVRALEMTKGIPRSLEGLDVEIVHGSILDAEAVAKVCEGSEVVFHLAAKVDLDRDRDGSVFAVNVDGTKIVADLCARSGARLVHCSSHHALARHPLEEPLDERKPLALDDPCDYHRSKAVSEKLVLDAAAKGDLDVVICSPGTLIGPHDYEPSLIARALMDLSAGRVPVLMEVVSDYVDARDVASAMIEASTRGRRGERYLLTGEVLTMMEFAEIVGAITGRPMPRVCLPLWVGWAMLPPSLALARLLGKKPLFTAGVLRASVSNRVVSHDKARDELAFSPRPTREALEEAFAWYEELGLIASPAAVVQ